MTAGDVVVLGSYAVMVLAVGGEVVVAACKGRAGVLVSAATGAAMAFGGLVVGVGFGALLALLWRPLLAVSPLRDLWDGRPLLTAIAAFVVWDAIGWLYHWVGHRTAIGWAAHQPHHTGPHYDLTVGLRQSWLPVHGLLTHPLGALLGFELPTIAVCAASSSVLQFLQHTSAPIRFPRWVTATVMTPAAHRLHHAVDVNLGPIFTVWDRLAGTWVAPDGPPPPLGHISVDPNPLRLELGGWSALLSRRMHGSGHDQPGIGPDHDQQHASVR